MNNSVYFWPREGLVEITEISVSLEKHSRWGKPIYGGVFGHGEFLLVPTLFTEQGMPRITYGVFHRHSGMPFSISHDTKGGALKAARWMLDGITSSQLIAVYARCAAERAEQEKAYEERHKVVRERIERAEEERKKPRQVSKSRRVVFERSDGKCFYCSTSLVIEYGWHVEHKIPRSKGGTDLPDNLVAACAPCNMKKGARTPEQFKELLQSRGVN